MLTNELLYNKLILDAKQPDPLWKESCVGSECTLHQLSPYIGKVKSTIANDLIKSYSKKGDLIVEPFSGSGTIPLEAVLNGRNVFAADVNPYAMVLTMAKLHPPNSLKDALSRADELLLQASKLPSPDLRKVPKWVRQFFHPKTLKEAINFTIICTSSKNYFLFACLLGILHHQRPGFLSYPSSHLVPYLRDKKYPKEEFQEMYQYRDLRSRLISKIHRAFRRVENINGDLEKSFQINLIQKLKFPRNFDCLITSPPYMNTLDYTRDNRLRLWFINPNMGKIKQDKAGFIDSITSLATNSEKYLNIGGFCILIVGERIFSNKVSNLSNQTFKIMEKAAPSLRIISVVRDDIPDIRRARKNCKSIKAEHILIFQKDSMKRTFT